MNIIRHREMEPQTFLVLWFSVLILSFASSYGQGDNSGDSGDRGEGGDDGAGGEDGEGVLSTPLIAVVALIGVFAVVIIVLTIAIVVMCGWKSARMGDCNRDKSIHAGNTYRGFSQERTQSPSESGGIHDPLSRPPTTRSSRTHSHSHLVTSPISLHPPPATPPNSSSTTTPPLSVPAGEDPEHAYHHLRQHEGMSLPVVDYPPHEYSNLGPRSGTPPLRPPKSVQVRNAQEETVVNSSSNDPSVLTTMVPSVATAVAPSWSGENSRIGTPQTSNHIASTVHNSPSSRHHTAAIASADRVTRAAQDDNDDAFFPRRSIYDTMPEGDTTETRSKPVSIQMNERGEGVHGVTEGHVIDWRPSKPRGGRYDQLAMVTVSPLGQKQLKSNVKLFDDSDYSPADSGGTNGNMNSESQFPSDSVKIVDQKYAGDYERHPDYLMPQVDVPREWLREKYRGDYERDPTYFLKNAARSFSVSAAPAHVVSQEQKPRSSSLGLEPRTDKYRGDYERSEDYIIPPQLQNGNIGIGREDDYVLEPDPSYTGAYERHPDYVPPLVKRSSKTRILILPKDGIISSSVSSSSSHTGERPSHVPHEYTTLAAATKDPPQQYTTLNSNHSTIASRAV